MNIWLQLQVGRHIRGRLRKYGVDLDDQTVNQRRARFGSRTGLLSTIDLRSASDAIATELVNKLLPTPWVCLLHELRSVNTLWPDGQWRKNEKFSSMGNGFTFELESLLFYAICSAMSENVSVYGDDIVVPTENYSRVTEMLEFCGFEVNTSKSYSTGLFRESCGGDYFGGFSCTPVFLRSLPRTVEDVVLLHNQVFRFCRESGLLVWQPFGKLLRKWRKRHPSFTGPMGYGDGHYHVDQAHAEGYSFCQAYQNGWWFRTLTRVYRKGVDSFDGATVRSFPAALCASTGPKAVRSIWASTMDRRYYRLKRERVWASCWPTTSWV